MQLRSDRLVDSAQRTVHIDLGDKDALEENRRVEETSAELVSFEADIDMKIRYVQAVDVLVVQLDRIKEAVAAWPVYVLQQKLSRQAGSAFLLEDLSNPEIADEVGFAQNLRADTKAAAKGPGSDDWPLYGNEKYTGVNVAAELNKKDPINVIAATQLTAARLPGRTLQLVEKKTIYEETRVLYSKTILNKLFQVSLNTKCDLLVYTFDVKVNCVGKVIAKYFGQTKTVKVFDFTKSVSFAWSYTKTFQNTWGAKIWIGFPKPLKFIGLNLII